MSITAKVLARSAGTAICAMVFASSHPARQDNGSVLFIPVADAQTASSVPSTAVAAGIALHSVSVDLPGSDRMFPGDASAEAINNNCLACHSAGMVLNQPLLSPTVWGQEVGKMRSLYRAPVAEADVPAILAYLSTLKTGR